MCGSVDVVVAWDVALSSPSKPTPASDMTRFQRPRSDCLPHPNIITGGSNVSGSRKPPATPASRSSKDDAAPTVATDSSRLAAFLASTSLEPKPRAYTPKPKPLAQGVPSSSPTAVATRR
ncbi:uncharacterized protein LOC120675424 [Panicum virgatum]|uniref:Uncharacterized protein n=1 Tax=Panicum virgatum TaxID=38727 RepID=A0A8T0S023_PANVG|nr:uncharacterized protein LOC120675424 [Panicum virgatum]KAG2591044.1 hypothetical protein PVAP13_5NG446600 [Panicum virgatum]